MLKSVQKNDKKAIFRCFLPTLVDKNKIDKKYNKYLLLTQILITIDKKSAKKNKYEFLLHMFIYILY